MRESVHVVRNVLRRPPYAVVAFLGVTGTVVLSELALNPALTRDVLLNGSISPTSRVRVLLALLLGGPFDVLADGGFLLVSLLTGLVFALTAYRVRVLTAAERNPAAGASTGIGVFAAVLGGGCAGCGSALLAGVFGAGVAGGVAILPLGGTEIVVGSVCLLLLSIYWLTSSITGTCSIDENGRRE